MKQVVLRVLIAFIFTAVGSASFGSPDSLSRSPIQQDTLPSPPPGKDLLFYIQRTSNTNTIIYDVVVGPDGKPDADDPIHVYWIRYAEEAQKEELSYVQRNFAYGVSTKPSANGVIEFSFVSYKKMKMYLQFSEKEKRYIVWMLRGNKKIRVNRFYVRIDGGSFWFPKVTFIEIKGTEVESGNNYVERFKP